VRSTKRQAKRRGVASMAYKHIVCVFPENIITRFDVAVNDVAKEFAKRLRLRFLYNNLTRTSAGKFFCNNDLFINLCFQFANVRNDTYKAIAIGQFLQGCDQMIL
jgi:hypothetical protein